MCTNNIVSTQKILDPSAFERAVIDSPNVPSNLGALYRILQSHFKGLLRASPESRAGSICEILITTNYCFIAGVEKGTCGGNAIYLDALMPLQLHIVFQRLLAHPSVLPTLGSPPQHFDYPSLILLLSTPTTLVRGLDTTPEIDDELRGEAVDFLTITASEFIVMHEIGHVVEKHFSLFKRCLLIPSNVRRGIEYLADWYAIKLMSTRDHWYGATVPMDSRIECHKFKLIGFAIAVVWEVLNSLSSRNAYSPYYPKASTRSLISEGLIATHIPDAILRDEQARMVMNGIKEGRNAWEAVRWPVSKLPTEKEVEMGIGDMTAAQVALGDGVKGSGCGGLEESLAK